MLERARMVDLVVGPQSYHRLPDLLSARRDAASAWSPPISPPRTSSCSARAADNARAAFRLHHRAGRLRQVLHLLRRPLYARRRIFAGPLTAILAEAERLAASGARELTLLGQNVNAYRGPGPDGKDWSLAKLLQRLAANPGDRAAPLHHEPSPRHGRRPHRAAWRRAEAHALSAPAVPGRLRPHPQRDEPQAYERGLCRAHRRASGRRGPTSRFPPTSSWDFPASPTPISRQTLALVRRIGFARAFSFKYSARPGTPAASLPDQVPDRVARERLQALQCLHRSRKPMPSTRPRSGAALKVLFERAGRKPGQIAGRSPYLQAVHGDGPGGVDRPDCGG